MRKIGQILLILCICWSSTLLFAQSGSKKLIPYRKGKLWGFCDINKKIVIQPIFRRVGFFKQQQNMYCATGIFKKDHVLIMEDGDYIYNTKTQVGHLEPYVKKKVHYQSTVAEASLSKDGKHGFRQGAKQKLYASPVYNGCAGVFSLKNGHKRYGIFALKKEGKVGVIDTAGNILLPFVYENLVLAHRQHLSFVAQQNGKIGLINLSGKVIIPFLYDELALINPTISIYKARKGKKIGLINTQSKVVYPFVLDALALPAHGLMAAKKGALYGYLTIHGKLAIPFKYNYDVGSFGEWPAEGAYAPIYISYQNYFFIDTKGIEYYEK